MILTKPRVGEAPLNGDAPDRAAFAAPGITTTGTVRLPPETGIVRLPPFMGTGIVEALEMGTVRLPDKEGGASIVAPLPGEAVRAEKGNLI